MQEMDAQIGLWAAVMLKVQYFLTKFDFLSFVDG